MTRDDPHPTAERGDLLTAALRVLLAERDYGSDEESRDAFAMTARAYVRAVDLLPDGDRPVGWDLDDVEDLRVRVAQLTGNCAWMRAAIARNDKTIGIFVDHHKKHPLPEDVRKRVVAAMNGKAVSEVTD